MATDNFDQFYFIIGCTGVLLVVVICIIYVFATQTARQFIFNGFWLTHKLIVIMYVLTILHGASVIVQKPMFFVYFIVPAILFAMDKMISLSRKKTEIAVLGAEKLPSGKKATNVKIILVKKHIFGKGCSIETCMVSRQDAFK